MARLVCIAIAGTLLLGAGVLPLQTARAQEDLTPPVSEPAPIPPPPPGYGGQQVVYEEPAPIRPQPALDPRPDRSGFTLEVGLGVSLVQSEETDGDVGLGIAPLSLGVGLFLNQDIALSVRATGATFFQDLGETLGIFAMQHYGMNMQLFVDDHFMVAGGPALSAIGALDGGDPELGFGVNVRAGYALLASRRINLRVLLELLMSAGHTEGTVFAQCLKAEFQLL